MRVWFSASILPCSWSCSTDMCFSCTLKGEYKCVCVGWKLWHNTWTQTMKIAPRWKQQIWSARCDASHAGTNCKNDTTRFSRCWSKSRFQRSTGEMLPGDSVCHASVFGFFCHSVKDAVERPWGLNEFLSPQIWCERWATYWNSPFNILCLKIAQVDLLTVTTSITACIMKRRTGQLSSYTAT